MYVDWTCEALRSISVNKRIGGVYDELLKGKYSIFSSQHPSRTFNSFSIVFITLRNWLHKLLIWANISSGDLPYPAVFWRLAVKGIFLIPSKSRSKIFLNWQLKAHGQNLDVRSRLHTWRVPTSTHHRMLAVWWVFVRVGGVASHHV